MVLPQPRMNPAGAESCDHTVHTNDARVSYPLVLDGLTDLGQLTY